MAVDQGTSAWEAMLIDANPTAPAVGLSSTPRNYLVVALRTTGLLVLAAISILVLLPAALAAVAAQAAVAG